MKLFWLLLHITLLSSLTVRSAEASSDNKSSIDFQAMQKSIVQLTQQIAVDMGKPIGNKPSEQEKSLPSIVPEVKKTEENKPTSYHQRANSYATNPDSDPPRYVRQLSDIGVPAFKDVN